MEYQDILFEVSEKIATITLNRPEARNALSAAMRHDLDRAMTEIKGRAGDDIKAVILTGAGTAFCSGGDVKSMANRKASVPEGRSRMREFHHTLFDLTNLEVPVIALVDGAAAGAGANIALTADFVLYFVLENCERFEIRDWMRRVSLLGSSLRLLCRILKAMS